MISPKLDVFAVLIFLGVIQAVFLAILANFGQQKFEISNRFLVFYLLGNAAMLLEIFLCYSGYIVQLLHYYDASEPLNFAFGPILAGYLYTYLHKKHPKNWHLHFIPFGLYILYAMFFFIQSADYKYNAFLDAYHPDITPIVAHSIYSEDPLGIKDHINLISIIFNGIYFGWAIKILTIFFKKQSLNFWKSPQTDLRWLRNLFLLSAINYIHWVYRTFFVFRDLQDYTSAAMNAAVIYYVSFVMLQFPEIFRKKAPTQPKYAKSTLDDAHKEAILTQLTQLMEQEKLYRDNLLSLTQLSKKMAVSTHSISQVLNEKLQKNFFGFLAHYRINEAKTILNDLNQQKLTIEEIAEMVGYNSKSAFNNAFKKLTNCTPSAYRKKNI